jgi:hypothetical protein
VSSIEKTPDIAADAADGRTPFEAFALDFLAARGADIEARGPLEWEATLPADLAKKWRRQAYRLIFDADRVTLPRGGAFAAPGSFAGLRLLETARGEGHVARFHAEAKPGVDARALAGEGFVLHDVESGKPAIGEPGHTLLLAFHTTLTFLGGSPEQDLRSILVDPRGPSFDFWEPEERRSAGLVPGFPADYEPAPFDRAALWAQTDAWLARVLEPRAERWRKKAEEGRERDLLRLNTFYQTRIQEERDRRRRRRSEDADSEEPATEAALKLEWGRRTKAVRSRYEPAVEVRLWGIEEIARPRQLVTYPLTAKGKKVGALEVEVDLAAGALVKPPCPVCGRTAGEFWWDGGGLVCRRCRGRKPRAAKNAASDGVAADGAAPKPPKPRRKAG